MKEQKKKHKSENLSLQIFKTVLTLVHNSLHNRTDLHVNSHIFASEDFQVGCVALYAAQYQLCIPRTCPNDPDSADCELLITFCAALIRASSSVEPEGPGRIGCFSFPAISPISESSETKQRAFLSPQVPLPELLVHETWGHCWRCSVKVYQLLRSAACNDVMTCDSAVMNFRTKLFWGAQFKAVPWLLL